MMTMRIIDKMMSVNKLFGSYKIVDVSKLFVSPLNARQQNEESKTSEGFQWLCESIKSEGLLEPLVVRQVGNQYEIVAGTRRFAALKHIGAQQTSVIVKEMDDNDVRIASLVENIQRMDLTEDEKQTILEQIYLTTWDEWKPKDWQLRDYSTDENKIKLARNYLSRLHNEANKTVANYSKVNGNNDFKYKNEKNTQQYFPTDSFKHLSHRVGYAVSTQINILRGYGAFSHNKNYVEELPPTIKEIVEAKAKEEKLKEAEKQQLAKLALAHQKRIRNDKKKPKTVKQKIERTAKTYVNKVKRQREAEQYRIEQQTQKLQKVQKPYKPLIDPEESINAVRARGEILELGHKLFKLLTGQEMHGTDPRTYEIFAKNTQAIETMKQLTTYFAGSSDIAAQQQIIIPLYVAIGKYRDILYEAVEAQKRKEEMSGE